MTEPDIAAVLPHLRSTILMRPAQAAVYLHQLTAPRTPRVQPAHLADALGLLAETYLRLHQTDDARHAAVAARHVAQTLNPGDRRRVIAVQGIAADIAVRTGQPEAEAAAITYCTSAVENDPDTDTAAHQRRLLLAAGLIAVAAYRTNCADGRAQLDRLRTTLTTLDWPAGLAVITRAVTAAHQLCHGHHDNGPAHRPPPMPGGLLHPDVHHPPDDYLTDRLTAHPPTHHQHTEPTTSATDTSRASAHPGRAAGHHLEAIHDD